MANFEALKREIQEKVVFWESKLLDLSPKVISERKNDQDRSIKQIVGHMIDSASNNKHRIIHMQYQGSPLIFPDYASFGNNDRWIAIQNYQDEDWYILVKLWKFIHLHLVHIIGNIDSKYLSNQWVSALEETISLKEMVLDFPEHFKLHINQINELIEAE